jgi:cytochrome c biogenesis protein CcdA
MAGLLYTLGRALTYLAVALLVIHGLLAVPLLSNFLQRYMNQLLGPILLLTGFLLLDILKLSGRGWRVNAGLQAWLDRHCLIGATLLGSLLALTFCPVSAGIFFGALIPLALRSQAHWLMPLCYGIGTALPVIGFAFVLAFATQWLGLFFGKITIIEFWVRRLTAIILILIGIFLIITRNFGIL